uniref:Glycosyltransferase family 92 protein n=1 Tax=Plectus sambesii TaxID=2011161 RepID=A0A914VWS1_9BILA
MLVAAIGIWRHYGANEVVVYYLSALETVYRLMKAYESSGLIRLESFPSLPSFDDNVHLFEKIEWRNQPSAYLDCLYSYREAAQYIIFADPDDVLVPKLGQTYLSEFEQLFERWPDASGFLYNRLDLEIYHDSIGKPIGEFRLDELLQNYKPRNCAPTPATKYAAIPSRIIGAWIHNSGRIVGDFVDHKISCEENSFLHFRTWFQSSAQNQGKDALVQGLTNSEKNKQTFAKENIQMMQEHYQQVIRSNNVSDMIPHDGEMLIRLMENCYAQRHAGIITTKCPGPHMCSFPPVNRTCVLAKGRYTFIAAKRTMKFSVLNSAQYETADSCFR